MSTVGEGMSLVELVDGFIKATARYDQISRDVASPANVKDDAYGRMTLLREAHDRYHALAQALRARALKLERTVKGT